MDFDLSAAVTKLQAMWRLGVAQLPNLVIATVFLVIVWWASKGVCRGVASIMVRAGQPAGVGLVIGRLVSWALRVVGVLVSLTILVPSMDAAALFGALGIGGVAIGFAFKDIFQNLLAGLLLLVTRPFQIGDIIVAGPHEGRVEDIQIRATRVRLFDGRVVVVPNSDLYTGRVEVYNPKSQRRGTVEVGVTYDTDIAHAKAVILQTVSQIEGVLAQPAPTVVTRAFGDSSIDLLVRYWIGPPNRRDLISTADDILSALKPALDAAGIEIAFPTRVLVMQGVPSSPESTLNPTPKRADPPAVDPHGQPGGERALAGASPMPARSTPADATMPLPTTGRPSAA